MSSPLQTSTVDILYATDRKREGDEDDPLKYGYRRSYSLACGSLVVEIGKDLSWDDLVAASRTKKRKVRLPLKVVSIEEKGRFPDTPAPIGSPHGLANQLPLPRAGCGSGFVDLSRERPGRLPAKPGVGVRRR